MNNFVPKKQTHNEKGFYSYKKLWKSYKIARGKSNDLKNPDRVKFAKKLLGVAKGLHQKGLIEKMPVFEELK